MPKTVGHNAARGYGNLNHECGRMARTRRHHRMGLLRVIFKCDEAVSNCQHVGYARKPTESLHPHETPRWGINRHSQPKRPPSAAAFLYGRNVKTILTAGTATVRTVIVQAVIVVAAIDWSRRAAQARRYRCGYRSLCHAMSGSP